MQIITNRIYVNKIDNGLCRHLNVSYRNVSNNFGSAISDCAYIILSLICVSILFFLFLAIQFFKLHKQFFSKTTLFDYRLDGGTVNVCLMFGRSGVQIPVLLNLTQHCKRLPPLIFARRQLCCLGATLRRWAPHTRNTQGRI